MFYFKEDLDYIITSSAPCRVQPPYRALRPLVRAPWPILLPPWAMAFKPRRLASGRVAEEDYGAPSREREHEIESAYPAPSALVLCHSGKRMDQMAVSHSADPALVLSNSGKRIDPLGRAKKYVKQVTERLNDTELQLAALRGDLAAVKQILGEVEAQVMGAPGDAEFESEVVEIRAAKANEANDMGETALFVAAEKGFLDVVVKLLKFSDRESLSRKNKSGFDALHVAAREGHKG